MADGRLFVFAPNIWEGGGARLLGAVLSGLAGQTVGGVAVDARYPLPDGLSVPISKFSAGLAGRVRAEWWLHCEVREDDIVLCLSNLGPLFGPRGEAIVYVQNRTLLESRADWVESPRQYFKRLLCRWWLHWRAGGVSKFYVQTPSMQAALKSAIGQDAEIFPFMQDVAAGARVESEHVSEDKRFDFIYVSSGVPHKNHSKLLDAWRFLADEGIRPSLCLTVDAQRSPRLCAHIDRLVSEENLALINVGTVPEEAVPGLYRAASALIFPSLLESFGLPLVEARRIGLPILAPERDYVRDVVEPHQTFDPHSAVSIARAVKRFLGYQIDLPVVKDGAEFIREICGTPAAVKRER